MKKTTLARTGVFMLSLAIMASACLFPAYAASDKKDYVSGAAGHDEDCVRDWSDGTGNVTACAYGSPYWTLYGLSHEDGQCYHVKDVGSADQDRTAGNPVTDDDPDPADTDLNPGPGDGFVHDATCWQGHGLTCGGIRADHVHDGSCYGPGYVSDHTGMRHDDACVHVPRQKPGTGAASKLAELNADPAIRSEAIDMGRGSSYAVDEIYWPEAHDVRVLDPIDPDHVLQSFCENAHNMLEYIQMSEVALSDVHGLFQRMNELCVKYLNDTNRVEDRNAILSEVLQISYEILRVSENAKIGDWNPLAGGTMYADCPDDYEDLLKCWTNRVFPAPDDPTPMICGAAFPGWEQILAGENVEIDQDVALAAVGALKDVIDRVSRTRSRMGAVQNMCERVINFWDITSWNVGDVELLGDAWTDPGRVLDLGPVDTMHVMRDSLAHTLEMITVIQTCEGGLVEIHDMYQRTYELLVKASNGTENNRDRYDIYLEIEELLKCSQALLDLTSYKGWHPFHDGAELRARFGWPDECHDYMWWNFGTIVAEAGMTGNFHDMANYGDITGTFGEIYDKIANGIWTRLNGAEADDDTVKRYIIDELLPGFTVANDCDAYMQETGYYISAIRASLGALQNANEHMAGLEDDVLTNGPMAGNRFGDLETNQDHTVIEAVGALKSELEDLEARRASLKQQIECYTAFKPDFTDENVRIYYENLLAEKTVLADSIFETSGETGEYKILVCEAQRIEAFLQDWESCRQTREGAQVELDKISARRAELIYQLDNDLVSAYDKSKVLDELDWLDSEASMIRALLDSQCYFNRGEHGYDADISYIQLELNELDKDVNYMVDLLRSAFGVEVKVGASGDPSDHIEITENGTEYAYRIRYFNSMSPVSDVILVSYLENAVPDAGQDPDGVYEAGNWKSGYAGTVTGIDLSDAAAKNAVPEVYAYLVKDGVAPVSIPEVTTEYDLSSYEKIDPDGFDDWDKVYALAFDFGDTIFGPEGNTATGGDDILSVDIRVDMKSELNSKAGMTPTHGDVDGVLFNQVTATGVMTGNVNEDHDGRAMSDKTAVRVSYEYEARTDPMPSTGGGRSRDAPGGRFHGTVHRPLRAVHGAGLPS